MTGAQQGIGGAIALAMAGEGADVAIAYLDDAAAAESVAKATRALGRRPEVLRADVSKLATIAVAKVLIAAARPGAVINLSSSPRADLWIPLRYIYTEKSTGHVRNR